MIDFIAHRIHRSILQIVLRLSVSGIGRMTTMKWVHASLIISLSNSIAHKFHIGYLKSSKIKDTGFDTKYHIYNIHNDFFQPRAFGNTFPGMLRLCGKILIRCAYDVSII